MDRIFQPFTTSLLGSLPRSEEIMHARRKLKANKISGEEMKKLLDDETKKAVEMQERCGIEIITNGELGRDNYVSFVADRLDHVLMLSMGDMIEYMEDKKSFEQILDTLDVPSVSIKNAICNGKITHNRDLVAHEMAQLKQLTTRPVKATLPGPYLMTRSMWLPALSQKYYENKEELGEAVIAVLKAEIDRLEEEGVELVQFDEPVLTEVVFTEGKTRSFMCAALSEKKDPAEELAFASHLIKSLTDYIRGRKIMSSLHVCRGNWSRDESILLKGPYTPLIPVFEAAAPDVLTLEFSTPRAGELDSLLSSEKIREQSILGLGVINPRTDVIESEDTIIRRAEEALKWLPKEKVWLNPDCGFATFANRPVNTWDNIEKKLSALQKAKQYLREKYDGYL